MSPGVGRDSAAYMRGQTTLTRPERGEARPARGQLPPQVSIQVGYTTFPGEIFLAPRSWVEKGYPTLFATEIRAAFKSLC